MAGLALLKHMYDLSDEALCDRRIENPDFQFFCGEEFFQHRLPFDRSSLTRWRQRMGEAKLTALIQESLSVWTRTEAMKPKDLARVVVDTTVQPKAVMFPTDAKLLNRARERLVRLAAHVGVELRQSYARVGKLALIKHQRYAHAHQSSAPTEACAGSRPISRVIRDIGRRIDGDPELEEIFAWPLSLSRRVLAQDQRQRGPKVYSLHAPEVECIGKGKAHRPYEFGVKVSVATTAHRSNGVLDLRQHRGLIEICPGFASSHSREATWRHGQIGPSKPRVPSVAKSCAMPMPKPISCPHRGHVSVNAPIAACLHFKCHQYGLRRWVLYSHRVIEDDHHAVISVPFQRAIVVDDDFADGRMVVASARPSRLPRRRSR